MDLPSPVLDLGRLPIPGPHFVGRDAELARLDAAWEDPRIHVLTFVAFGGVGTGFALACILLGLQFARFVSAAYAGRLPLPHRPPGVEGFLPISGLMGLVDWFRTGTLNTVHPAAAMIVLISGEDPRVWGDGGVRGPIGCLGS